MRLVFMIAKPSFLQFLSMLTRRFPIFILRHFLPLV